MGKTVRSNPKTSLESELHRALKDARSHKVHILTQLLGEKGIGVRNVSSFTCLDLAPNKREGEWMLKWSTSGKTEREFQADMPPLEPLDMKHGDKSENDPLQSSEGAGGRKQAQSSATSECASRALLHVRLAFVLVDGTAETGRHGWEEITKSAKKELVSVLVHAQRAFHTPAAHTIQTAP